MTRVEVRVRASVGEMGKKARCCGAPDREAVILHFRMESIRSETSKLFLILCWPDAGRRKDLCGHDS